MMFFHVGCVSLQFPNAVILNAIGRRNTQMRAKERKRAQTQVRKRAQKSAKERFCIKIVNNEVWELPSFVLGEIVDSKLMQN